MFEVDIAQVQTGQLGSATTGEIAQGDDGAIAGAGRSVVSGAHRQQGVELVVFDVAVGGESAAGHWSEIHGPQVVVGGQGAEPPRGLEGASAGGDVFVGSGRGVAAVGDGPGQGSPDGRFMTRSF